MERFESQGQIQEGKLKFSLPKSLPQDYFGYAGTWQINDEYSVAQKNSILEFHFSANHVYLVMIPSRKNDTVKIWLDGIVVQDTLSGKDVKAGVVILDAPRLYDLINLHGKNGDHKLRLQFETDGTQLYAFTFG